MQEQRSQQQQAPQSDAEQVLPPQEGEDWALQSDLDEKKRQEQMLEEILWNDEAEEGGKEGGGGDGTSLSTPRQDSLLSHLSVVRINRVSALRELQKRRCIPSFRSISPYPFPYLNAAAAASAAGQGEKRGRGGFSASSERVAGGLPTAASFPSASGRVVSVEWESTARERRHVRVADSTATAGPCRREGAYAATREEVAAGARAAAGGGSQRNRRRTREAAGKREEEHAAAESGEAEEHGGRRGRGRSLRGEHGKGLLTRLSFFRASKAATAAAAATTWFAALCAGGSLRAPASTAAPKKAEPVAAAARAAQTAAAEADIGTARQREHRRRTGRGGRSCGETWSAGGSGSSSSSARRDNSRSQGSHSNYDSGRVSSIGRERTRGHRSTRGEKTQEEDSSGQRHSESSDEREHTKQNTAVAAGLSRDFSRSRSSQGTSIKRPLRDEDIQRQQQIMESAAIVKQQQQGERGRREEQLVVRQRQQQQRIAGQIETLSEAKKTQKEEDEDEGDYERREVQQQQHIAEKKDALERREGGDSRCAAGKAPPSASPATHKVSQREVPSFGSEESQTAADSRRKREAFVLHSAVRQCVMVWPRHKVYCGSVFASCVRHGCGFTLYGSSDHFELTANAAVVAAADAAASAAAAAGAAAAAAACASGSAVAGRALSAAAAARAEVLRRAALARGSSRMLGSGSWTAEKLLTGMAGIKRLPRLYVHRVPDVETPHDSSRCWQQQSRHLQPYAEGASDADSDAVAAAAAERERIFAVARLTAEETEGGRTEAREEDAAERGETAAAGNREATGGCETQAAAKRVWQREAAAAGEDGRHETAEEADSSGGRGEEIEGDREEAAGATVRVEVAGAAGEEIATTVGKATRCQRSNQEEVDWDEAAATTAARTPAAAGGKGRTSAAAAEAADGVPVEKSSCPSPPQMSASCGTTTAAAAAAARPCCCTHSLGASTLQQQNISEEESHKKDDQGHFSFTSFPSGVASSSSALGFSSSSKSSSSRGRASPAADTGAAAVAEGADVTTATTIGHAAAATAAPAAANAAGPAAGNVASHAAWTVATPAAGNAAAPVAADAVGPAAGTAAAAALRCVASRRLQEETESLAAADTRDDEVGHPAKSAEPEDGESDEAAAGGEVMLARGLSGREEENTLVCGGACGCWSLGKRVGWGVAVRGSGRALVKYEGLWRDDYKEGWGIQTLSHCVRYAGSFRNGLQHGKSLLLYPTGVLFAAEWRCGVLVEQQLLFATYSQPPQRRQNAAPTNPRQQHAAVAATAAGAVAVAPTAAGAGGAAPTAAGVAVAADDACVSYRFGGEATAEVQDKLHVQQQGQQLLQTAGSRAVSGEEAALGERMTRPGGREEAEVAEKITAADGRETRAAEGTKIAACTRRLAGDTGAAEDDNEERRGQAGGTGVARKNPIGTSGRGEEGNADFRGTARIAAAVADEASTETEKERREIAEKRASRQQSSSSRSSTDRKVSLDMGRGSSAGGCQRPESCSRIRCFARRSKDKVAPRSQSSGARALSEGAGEIGGSSGRAAAAAYGSGCSLAAPGSQEKTAASEAPEKDRAAAPPAARGAKTAGKSRSAVLIRGKAREEQSHGDAEGQPRDEERLRQQYEAVRALSSASACDQWDEQQTQHLLMWAATPQRLRVLLQQQAVDGAALLSATEEDLKEMNIERWEDRRMLLLLVGLLLKLQHRQKQRLRYSSRHLQKHALLLSVVGIPAAELQLEARIGEGGYSRVYRARWKYTRSLELHQLQRHYDQQRQIQQQVLHQQTQLLQQQHELRRGLLQTQNSVQQQFLQQTRDSPLLRQQQISRPQRQDCQQQQTTQQQTTQQQHFPASFNVPLEEPQLREGARQYNAKNAASTAAVLSSLASIAPAAAAVNFSAAARYGAAAGLNVTGPVGSVAGGVSSHGGDGRPRAEKVFSHGWRSRFGLCHGSRQKTPKRLQSAAARQQQEQQQEQQHGACPPASDSPTSAASCHVAAAGQPASGGQPGPPVKPQTLPQAWHGVAEAAGAIDSLGDAQALRDNIKNLIHNANEETAPEARNAAFTMGFPHLTGVHDHTSRLATGIRKAVADSLEEDEAMEAAADDAAETTCQRRAASINWRPSAAWDDTPEGRPNLRGAADVRGPAADARRAAADARGIAFDARGGSADTRGEETDTREGDDADTRRRVTDAHEGDADWEDKWRRNAPDGGSSLTWKEAAEGRGAGHWGSDIMKFGETGKSVLLRQWQGRVPAEWRSNRSSSRSLWSSMLRSRRRRSSSRRRGRVGEAEGEVLVAVKVFRQRQQKALQRSFYSELAVLSRLAHPNITMLLGAVSAPIYGLVTEYVPCGSLFDLLHASHQQQQDWAGSPQQQRQERQGVDLSLMQIVRLARDICLGMAYLHQQGVLHCDLKSPNVLLTAKGEVKLCDFGLATIVETLHEAPVNDFQANEGWGAEPPRKSPSNNRRRDQEKAETECDDAKEKKERSNSRDNGSKDCNSRDCSRTDCSRRDCSSRHCSSRDCISRDCSSRDCSSKDCNSRDCSRKDCSRSDCSGKHCIGSRHCSSSAPERVGRGSDSGSSASRRRGRQGKRNTKRGTEEEDSEVFGRQQDVARIPAAGTSRRRCEKYTNSTPRGYSRRSSKARSGSRTCSSRARSGSNNCSGMEEETQENWCEVGSSGCSFHRPSHATSSSRLLPAEKISETLHARSREEGNSTSVGMTPGECEADKEVECAKLAKEREEIFTVVATDDRNKETASDPSLRKKHFTYIPVHYAETPEENRLQPQRQQQQAERQQHQEMQQHQGMQQHQQEEPRRPGQGEVGSVESSGRARRMNKQESERSSGVFPERSSSQRMSPRRTGIVGEPGGVKLEPAHLGCVGTHHWMAPEVLRGEAFTTAADVYSFGVILWEILHRKIPFQNMTSPAHLIIAIGYGGAQLDVSRAPPPLRYILSRCLDHNPERRPSFSWCAEQLHALYTANVLDVEVNLSMLLGLGQ